jgi:hypothetical protein
VVETAILADNDDDVLDRAGSLDRMAVVIPIVIVSGSDRCAKAKNRYSGHKHVSSGFLFPFSCVTRMHIFLQVKDNLWMVSQQSSRAH